MTTMIQRSMRPGISFCFIASITAILIGLTGSPSLADDAKVIRLLRPLNGATVRETIPIRVSPADLPSTGYFIVSIDKIFRTAEVITPGDNLLYVWDSQAPYEDPNQPGVAQFTNDGEHEIEVAVYDQQGTLLANGSATVNLANRISNLPDGVKLSYGWNEDETLHYKRHSELSLLSSDTGTSAQNLETADVRFARSVEDVNGDQFLVRDQVYPNGILLEHSVPTLVQNLFVLKSRYRTVDSYGNTLVEETPFSVGDHLGFSIAQLPSRRITVGDSWDTKIEVSLPWASEKPTDIDGSGRLDSFEWQDGYPTAKVIETYDGPATLYADVKGTVSFQADDVHVVRTYWFAYNSRRLVKSRTDMTVDSNVTQEVQSEITSGAGSGAGIAPQMAPQVMNPFSGDQGTSNPNEAPGMETPTSTVPIKLEVIDDVTLVGV